MSHIFNESFIMILYDGSSFCCISFCYVLNMIVILELLLKCRFIIYIHLYITINDYCYCRNTSVTMLTISPLLFDIFIVNGVKQ